MSYKKHFSDYFKVLSDTLNGVDIDSITAVTDEILNCYKRQGTIYIFGNGGSSATASHVAGDFLKGISFGLEKRFKIISLNDNMPAFSAIANDLSYDEVFYEQLKTFLQPGDLVIGISGSGNSVNVVKAVEYAKSKKVKTIGFCGYNGGKLKDISDIALHAGIKDMEITEDIHILIFHAVKQLIISELKGNGTSMGNTYDKRIK